MVEALQRSSAPMIWWFIRIFVRNMLPSPTEDRRCWWIYGEVLGSNALNMKILWTRLSFPIVYTSSFRLPSFWEQARREELGRKLQTREGIRRSGNAAKFYCDLRRRIKRLRDCWLSTRPKSEGSWSSQSPRLCYSVFWPSFHIFPVLTSVWKLFSNINNRPGMIYASHWEVFLFNMSWLSLLWCRALSFGLNPLNEIKSLLISLSVDKCFLAHYSHADLCSRRCWWTFGEGS